MNPIAVYSNKLAVGIVMLVGTPNGQAQTAEDILNKADAIYTNAKTYQATYHWDEKWFDGTGKNDFSKAEVVQVEAVGTTKFALHEVYDKPKEDPPESSLVGGMDILDNGTNHYTYTTRDNSYTQSTHSKWMPLADRNGMLDMIVPRLKPRKDFTYTLLASGTVNGKAAYVIEAKGTREELQVPVFHRVEVNGHSVETFSSAGTSLIHVDDILYIDQSNYHLLQRKAQRTQPGLTVKITQIITSEVLDAPIPASVFVFRIPEGAKEN